MSRADRVAVLIQHEVSDIITRKLSDPRIGFASVTGVDIGDDLHDASIYISVMGTEEQKQDTIHALTCAQKFVRGELGHRLQLRDVPEIHFKRDDSIERGAKVFAIINKLHKEKACLPSGRLEIKKPKCKKSKKR